MWLPLWDKSIKQLTASGPGSRALALGLWRYWNGLGNPQVTPITTNILLLLYYQMTTTSCTTFYNAATTTN